MPASVERDSPALRFKGRVFWLGPNWVVCSFRLPTSMPIPLEVVAPSDISLETWAFRGMAAQADRQVCLLLLRAHGGAARSALAHGMLLVVATHFHPVAIATDPAEAADGLPLGDRTVMAQAILSAMKPRNVAALADPVTLLAPALREVSVPKEAPEVTLAADPSVACTISGTHVPDYVLFDAEAGLRCIRVATARLSFSPTPSMDLDLEPLWGPEIGSPRHTFLVANGRFTTARLRAAAA